VSYVCTSRKEAGSWQVPLCLRLQASPAREPECRWLHYDGVGCLSQRAGGPVAVAERTKCADGTLQEVSTCESVAAGMSSVRQCAVVLWVTSRMRFSVEHGMSIVNSLQWYRLYVSSGTNASAIDKGMTVGRGSF